MTTLISCNDGDLIDDPAIKKLAKGGLLETEIESITLLGTDEDTHRERSDEALAIMLPKRLPRQPVVGFKTTSK